MKVIFLDVDGVLNSSFWNDSHQREISEGIYVNPEQVRLFGELVADTGAEVVLHSGWRFWLDEDLSANRLEAQNFLDLLEEESVYLYSCTPDLTTEVIRRTKQFSLVKAEEIKQWIAIHPDIEQWIVLDDLPLHDDEVELHQVRTDSAVGLTTADVELARNMLQEEL